MAESTILREVDTEDNIIYTAEGTLRDGRHYQAEFWQLGSSYHLTLLVPTVDGETPDDLSKLVEDDVIQFCGEKFVRIEHLAREGEAVWSYNAVACDEAQQYLSRMPMPWGGDSFSVWYEDRQVTFEAKSTR